MPDILLFISILMVGSILHIKANRKNIFGRFRICYVYSTGEYVPWITRVYNTEEEYEYEERELAKIACNKDMNSYFRYQGVMAFAIINLVDNKEIYWIRLCFS